MAVRIKPLTRLFLDQQATALGSSASSLAGTILDAVAEQTMQIDGGNMGLRPIADRVYMVLREHGLSIPAAAHYLAPMGLGMAELRDSESLALAMTANRVAAFASTFSVQPDWLVGKRATVVMPGMPQWVGNAGNAARAIADEGHERSTRLYMLRSARGDLDLSGSGYDDRHSFMLFVERNVQGVNNEPLRTFRMLQHGNWGNYKARWHLKILVSFLASKGVRSLGFVASEENYTSLLSGEILPVSVFPPFQSYAFYPEDYTDPSHDRFREPEDWAALKADRMYAHEKRCFDGDLARRKDTAESES